MQELQRHKKLQQPPQGRLTLLAKVAQTAARARATPK